MFMKNNDGKLTLFYTFCYCVKELREHGINEAFKAFKRIWPLHLHKWFGWIYRIPVEKYYKKHSIIPGAGLKVDLASNNPNALRYYSHAVKQLHKIAGVNNLLNELAKVERAPDEEISHEGERKYHNLLVELHGCYFTHKILKMKILDVEYGKNKILSPNRIGNRSCDIKCFKKSDTIYFECKDSSAEIKSGVPYEGVTITTPLNAYQNKKWLLDKMQEADDKGADYLLAKIPIWSPYQGKKIYRCWMEKVFENHKRHSCNNYSIEIDKNKYRSLKGAFLLLRKNAIKITFREKL